MILAGTQSACTYAASCKKIYATSGTLTAHVYKLEIHSRILCKGSATCLSSLMLCGQVGDVLQIQKDTFFPADLLLLSVPESADGLAYVETINLDGESNLKIKKALDQTQHITPETLQDFTVGPHNKHHSSSLLLCLLPGNVCGPYQDLPKSHLLHLHPQSVVQHSTVCSRLEYGYGCCI